MILLTGAAGMVGSHFLDIYAANELYRTDLRPDPLAGIHHLDIRNFQQVLETVERVKPTLVIHLAAETDVDLCEREVDHAYQTNALGTLNVTLACQRYNVDLVYVSTIGVFDGSNPEPYTEFDQPAPGNVYARAKWEGEKIVQNFHPRHYIVRAGWMFGGKEKDKKFVAKIVHLCQTQSEIRIVSDKIGNPTYARDLIYNIKMLTATGLYGLYHVVGEGWSSRYDIAKEIVSFLGLDTKVVPINSAAFPLPARRPRSEAARSYKLDLLGLNYMRHWKEALHDYLGSLNADQHPEFVEPRKKAVYELAGSLT